MSLDNQPKSPLNMKYLLAETFQPEKKRVHPPEAAQLHWSLPRARFVKAGANSITVHAEPEAKHNVAKTLQQIRDAGCRAGLTLNPETSFDLVVPYLGQIDMLLVMTVHPGFGGQSFRADQMSKVKR